jgi:hypothetical protein
MVGGCGGGITAGTVGAAICVGSLSLSDESDDDDPDDDDDDDESDDDPLLSLIYSAEIGSLALRPVAREALALPLLAAFTATAPSGLGLGGRPRGFGGGLGFAILGFGTDAFLGFGVGLLGTAAAGDFFPAMGAAGGGGAVGLASMRFPGATFPDIVDTGLTSSSSSSSSSLSLLLLSSRVF